MNTRPVLDSYTGPFALSASFNNDNSHFSVALYDGFRVFNSRTAELTLAREFGGGIGSVEMLGITRYMALVGGGRQPKFPQNKVRNLSPQDVLEWDFVHADRYEVQIWNDKTQVVAASLEFKTAVQRVRISRTHLVVVLLNSVKIYKMRSPPVKIAEYETVDNPLGLCCLGTNIVAFPGLTPGQVKVFNLEAENITILPGHQSPLRAIGLSQNGDMVATASRQGTLIRLWSYPSGSKITEFRRGIDPAVILSLAFSPNGRILAATSDKSTLHLFDVPHDPTAEPNPNTQRWGILAKVPLLPRQFSDTYASATIKFELGDDPVGAAAERYSTMNALIPGVPGGTPTKGLAGWLDDHTLVIVSAGKDARWERFIVGADSEGRCLVGREGWKRYLE
ncbi:WD40 repeat-like protein [Westerdykella ornata]|uniref:WD40 repeat-like protein n=1 Tax=Westerdykella ornata TaxID=318751 RepID=A0A6A6J554_WESOR|nr:WD40 repeat-like protein [Westerdykella ornata]KAF2271522.1 WD40 repeat-like protein [Westerdykella ornata]